MKRGELRARLEAAQKQVLEARAAVDAAKANVALAQASMAQAKTEAGRYASHYARGAIPKERKERVETAYDVHRHHSYSGRPTALSLPPTTPRRSWSNQ